MCRILIVDDHPVLREALELVIEQGEGLESCGSAGSAEEALEVIGRSNPDLLLTDLSLPGRNGIELIRDLQGTRPELPVLVISMRDELIYAERVLRAGGRGYVPKEAGVEVLLGAIACVLRGGVYLSPAVSGRVLRNSGAAGRARMGFPLQGLTRRELEVLGLIGRGKDDRAIAQHLAIRPRTVKAHRERIRKKMGLEDGTVLARFAMRWLKSWSRLS